MQTDEYLTWLFIKHGSVGQNRAGKEDSLSASAEHANWPGARRPEGGLETVHTKVGQPTVLYMLKIFTQWHTKWLIRIRSILRSSPQFSCSRTQRLLPVIKAFYFQPMLHLLIICKLYVHDSTLKKSNRFPFAGHLRSLLIELAINQSHSKSLTAKSAAVCIYQCVSKTTAP